MNVDHILREAGFCGLKTFVGKHRAACFRSAGHDGDDHLDDCSTHKPVEWKQSLTPEEQALPVKRF